MAISAPRCRRAQDTAHYRLGGRLLAERAWNEAAVAPKTCIASLNSVALSPKAAYGLGARMPIAAVGSPIEVAS